MTYNRPTPWYVWLAFFIVPFFGSTWLFRPERRQGSIWLRVTFGLAFAAGLGLASWRSRVLQKRVSLGVLLGFCILLVVFEAFFLVSGLAGLRNMCP
jgi:hypothetical protein